VLTLSIQHKPFALSVWPQVGKGSHDESDDAAQDEGAHGANLWFKELVPPRPTFGRVAAADQYGAAPAVRQTKAGFAPCFGKETSR
jgi:hypothetical protein